MNLQAQHRFDSTDPDASIKALQNDPFYINDAIRQFSKKNCLETTEHVIVVDSASRDTTIYPSPSRYRVYLNSSLQNVISCDLLSVGYPNVAYFCKSTNNKFVMEECIKGVVNQVAFQIPSGHYDGSMLAIELARMINALTNAQAGTLPYMVDFVFQRGKLVFKAKPTNVDKFRLLFTPHDGIPTGTCNVLLGFPGQDTVWNTDSAVAGVDPQDPYYMGALVSPSYINLFGDLYVYLSSPELNCSFHETSYNRSLDNAIVPAVANAFAKLSVYDESGSVSFYSANTATQVSRFFKPPLGRLESLEFLWLTKDGNLVDFHNMDSSFVLKFTCQGRSLGRN